jgi:hypothetical protein
MFKFLKHVWQKNWKGKATLIAGAFILIGAVVGVTYAIVTREGDEGLMRTEAGELHWDKKDLPIQCIYDNSLAVDELMAYNKARQELNTRVGVNLLSPCMQWLHPNQPFPTTPLRGHLLLHMGQAPGKQQDGVTMETPWDGHPGGTTLLVRKKEAPDTIYGVMVWIDLDQAKNDAVWLHELGHVLGLGHDRLRDSVMWPKIQERPGSLSKKDVKCLQRVYK